MQDFHELDLSKRSHHLVLSMYKVTQSMPQEEVFGIKMQLRRGATAIPTRIAEGCSRESSIEFGADLRRAIASCNEVEYLVLLAQDLKHLKRPVGEELTDETIAIRKMIYGLLRKM